MNQTVLADADIVALYFSRDERALAATQQQYAAYLTAIALNLLGSREDAEECVNDCYLRAWDSIPPAKPERLSAYLAKLLRNLALNRIEHDHAQKRGGGEYSAALEELLTLSDPADSVESRMDAEALACAVNAFLASLPRESRAAFIGRYFRMDSYRVIAKKLGCSESRVKSMLHRTREKLREYLMKEGVLS